jgi:hypothetical protein
MEFQSVAAIWAGAEGTSVMSQDGPDRAKHFRALAADTLIAAAEMTDPRAKSLLIDISVIYENIAMKIEAAEPTSPVVVPVVLVKKL